MNALGVPTCFAKSQNYFKNISQRHRSDDMASPFEGSCI